MIENILNIIKENISIYRDSTNDLKIRCPFCGDSKKNPRATKLYISKQPVPPYNTFMYHCFRAECKASGTLLELFFQLNLDSQLSKEQLSFLLQNTKIKKRNFTLDKDINLDDYQTKDEKYVDKIQYVKNRFGKQEIPGFISKTIVTTFRYLPIQNDINPKLFNFIETNFVGFRTFNKSKIICRNINKNSDFRYYNFQLSQFTDYYITSPTLNNLNPLKKGKILIAEGIFSVLNGFLKLQDLEFLNEKNIILSASLGGKSISFLHCYEFIIHSLGIPDWEVWILSDSEIDKSHYKFLKSKCLSELKILYNTEGEDFGCENVKPIFTYI